MRVTVDATSALLRSAGIKNYIWHWVRHLRRLAATDTIAGFPYLWDLGRLDHYASTLSAAATLPRLALLYFVNVPGNPALDWILSAPIFFTPRIRSGRRRGG